MTFNYFFCHWIITTHFRIIHYLFHPLVEVLFGFWGSMVESWLTVFLHLSPVNSLLAEGCRCVLSVWIHCWLCLRSQEARCGYAIVIMALYWCTECMPLAVTSLLPVILFPVMGIMKADEVLVPVARLHFFGETNHTGAENCKLLT